MSTLMDELPRIHRAELWHTLQAMNTSGDGVLKKREILASLQPLKIATREGCEYLAAAEKAVFGIAAALGGPGAIVTVKERTVQQEIADSAKDMYDRMAMVLDSDFAKWVFPKGIEKVTVEDFIPAAEEAVSVRHYNQQRCKQLLSK